MRRFTWPEMRAYWEAYSSRWSALDYDRDPDGLGNVVHAGGGEWRNRYHARFQRSTYLKLLRMVPGERAGRRALDVGCGAGRWCRLLAAEGYRVVGVDLQPELVAANSARYPDISFECRPVQDYSSAEPFDLISSVTVIQHVPFDEQDAVIGKMRSLARRGGHAIVLENVAAQAPHLFSNPPEGWIARFARGGFRLVAARRYDYSPFSRLYRAALRAAVSLPARGGERPGNAGPAEAARAAGRRATGWLRAADEFLRNLAVALDWPVESAATWANVAVPSGHRGMLFEAV